MKISEFNQLKQEYISLGGTELFLKKIGDSLTIRTEARLKYEIKKLQKSVSAERVIAKPKKSEPPYKANPQKVFKDSIAQYPAELHDVYRKRIDVFLQACSLKKQLNDLPDLAEKNAGNLQWQIWRLFEELDKCQKALKHWNEHKRLLPTEIDFSPNHIPDKRLHLELRNLRSKRSRRKQTIEKMKSTLLPIDADGFQSQMNLLNRKVEQLAAMDLMIEKIEKKLGL